MTVLAKLFGGELKNKKGETQGIQVGTLMGSNNGGMFIKFRQINLAGLVEQDQQTGQVSPVMGKALISIKWEEGVQPINLGNQVIKVTEGSRQGTDRETGQPKTFYDNDTYGYVNTPDSGKSYISLRVVKPLLNGMTGNMFPVEQQGQTAPQGQPQYGQQPSAPQGTGGYGQPAPQGQPMAPPQGAPGQMMAPPGQPMNAPQGAPGMAPPQGQPMNAPQGAPGFGAAPQGPAGYPQGQPQGQAPGYGTPGQMQA